LPRQGEPEWMTEDIEDEYDTDDDNDEEEEEETAAPEQPVGLVASSTALAVLLMSWWCCCGSSAMSVCRCLHTHVDLVLKSPSTKVWDLSSGLKESQTQAAFEG
jgi:hypothetical protein